MSYNFITEIKNEFFKIEVNDADLNFTVYDDAGDIFPPFLFTTMGKDFESIVKGEIEKRMPEINWAFS